MTHPTAPCVSESKAVTMSAGAMGGWRSHSSTHVAMAAPGKGECWIDAVGSWANCCSRLLFERPPEHEKICPPANSQCCFINATLLNEFRFVSETWMTTYD